MASQPRASIADALDGLTPDWDEIVRRARLTRNPSDLHDVEHDAQIFVDAVMQVFRGPDARRPSAGPLLVTGKGAWF